MKRTITFLIIASCFCIVTGSAIGQNRRAAAAPRAQTGRAIYGSTSDHVYTNSVLGIRMALPEALEISPPSYVDVSLVAGGVNSKIFGTQPIAVKNILTGAAFPAQFLWTVMKLPPSSANVTGEAILNDPLFRPAGAPAAKVETLGKTQMAYVDGSTRFVQNRSYAYVKKGYYISIVIMYKDKSDLDVLRETIAGADLDWNGK